MAGFNWSRWGDDKSWHIVPIVEAGSAEIALCGRQLPGPIAADDHEQNEGVTAITAGGEPPENEPTCETCLRVSHRHVEADL